MAEWFRGELKEFAHDAHVRAAGRNSQPHVSDQCWNQHQRGQRDWSALLWSVLMFKTWQEVDKAA